MNYYAFKTMKDWGEDFVRLNYVGIDQDHMDTDFRKIMEIDIDAMVVTGIVTRSIVRAFNVFVYDMSIGDMVVVGVGPTTKFAVKAIFRVVKDYGFDETCDPDDELPRHIRKCELIHYFEEPIPYEEFARCSRIEAISSPDWERMMSTIFKPTRPTNDSEFMLRYPHTVSPVESLKERGFIKE